MTKRTLLGILIDFSGSMRWNWENTNGKELPKVQTIHDALLKKLNVINLKTNINGIDYSKIELFCLGAGFVRNVYYNNVETSYREEKVYDETMTKSKQSDVICDILALPDIIPNKSDIEKIKVELNKKWNEYSTEIINKIDIPGDIYETLSSFIKSSLQETATSKLLRSMRYRAFVALKGLNLSKPKILPRWQESLDRYIADRIVLIEKHAIDESARLVLKVSSKSHDIVDSRKENFSSYITNKLNDFVSDQSIVILDLLIIARNHSFVLDHFNLELFSSLAQEIYNHLKSEVEKEINLSWKLGLGASKIDQLRIGAKLDIRELQKLVEDCMKKDIWHELRPFAEEVIQNLFESIFIRQIEERIPYWIGLASSREVIKPINKISLLIPETTDIDLYSEEYMYGIAPIKEALDRCAVRFTNRDHSRKKKVLILFSDGEFENTNPLFDPLRVADVIRKSGVRIICFYVGNRDVTRKGSTSLRKDAPQGAITMYNMSSDFSVDEPLEQQMIKRGLAIPNNKKLFFQINKTNILDEALQVLFVDSYESKDISEV